MHFSFECVILYWNNVNYESGLYILNLTLIILMFGSDVYQKI